MCSLAERREALLGLDQLAYVGAGLSVFKQTNKKLSRVTLYFFFGLASIAFMFSFFFNYSYYSYYDYSSFILLNLISFIYETCMNQQCDSRRLLLSCADVDFIL